MCLLFLSSSQANNAMHPDLSNAKSHDISHALNTYNGIGRPSDHSKAISLTGFLNPMQKPLDALTLFKEDLRIYKPTAPWITDSFMDMDFQQFGVAFKYIVKILTLPQERWFYFTHSPTGFDPENYWAECLWQCYYYERWMGSLSLTDNKLIYKDSNNQRIPFLAILARIENASMGNKLVNKYYQFYAFYTDCLSHFFCNAVYSCYESLDNVQTYKSFLGIAKKCLSKMKQNLSVLKKSKLFYPAYKMTFDNYKTILSLLEAEKLKNLVSTA